MPYNKGDFTQQGYGGYVSGGLHLNEKRCLTTKISSNEEAEGLDSVEINIHDHLNDLDYTITGENLTVGENVIGGGGDTLPKLHIKFNNDYATPVMVFGNQNTFNKLGSNRLEAAVVMVEKDASVEADFLYIYANNFYTAFDTPTTGIEITNLVNCTVDVEGDISYITITDPSLDASAEISVGEPK